MLGSFLRRRSTNKAGSGDTHNSTGKIPIFTPASAAMLKMCYQCSLYRAAAEGVLNSIATPGPLGNATFLIIQGAFFLLLALNPDVTRSITILHIFLCTYSVLSAIYTMVLYFYTQPCPNDTNSAELSPLCKAQLGLQVPLNAYSILGAVAAEIIHGHEKKIAKQEATNAQLGMTLHPSPTPPDVRASSSARAAAALSQLPHVISSFSEFDQQEPPPAEHHVDPVPAVPHPPPFQRHTTQVHAKPATQTGAYYFEI